MPHRALARTLVPLVACLALVVAGCGADTDEGAATGSSDPATASVPAEPTEVPTGSTGEPTAEPTGAEPAGLRDRLLSAAELPGLNDEWRWREDVTAQDPGATFATCQRFPITTAGAEAAVARRFLPAEGPAEGDAAGELVARFPDEQTARRAYAVLESWRGRCADRLGDYTRVDVGDLQPVPIDGGRAGWYLLSYGPVPGRPDDGYFDAQGMVLRGSRIALVTMVASGQDYNYEPGQEPMVDALTRAAAKLG